MKRGVERIKALEAAIRAKVSSVVRVERPIVKPGPTGPVLTGDVHVQDIGGSSWWEHRADIVGKATLPASGRSGLVVVVNKPVGFSREA